MGAKRSVQLKYLAHSLSIASFSWLVLWSTECLALPFRQTPESFGQYLNQLNWDGGARYTFSNLYNCNYAASRVNNPNSASPRAKAAMEKYDELDRIRLQIDDANESNRVYDMAKKWEELARKYAAEDGNSYSYETFSCAGYIKIQDPKGVRICDAYMNYSGDTRSSSFSSSNCRWR